MTCKDCYHNEVCEALYELNGVPRIFACQCAYFRNAADVVEVVRCKNCMHYELHGNGRFGLCKRPHKFHSLQKESDFCSYGERREE